MNVYNSVVHIHFSRPVAIFSSLVSHLFFLLFLSLFIPAQAQSMFIEPSADLISSKVVIFDIRDTRQFKKGHIKNSVNLPPSLMNKVIAGGATDEFSAVLSAVGATQEKKIIICPDWGKEEDLIKAGALAFFIKYAGINDVSVLSGGYQRWAGRSLAVSSTGTELMPAGWKPVLVQKLFFSPRSKRELLKSKGRIFIDVKTPENLDKINKEASKIKDLRHISINVFFNEPKINSDSKSSKEGKNVLSGPVSTKEGKGRLAGENLIKTKEELREILSVTGVNADKEIILYPGNRKETFFAAFVMIKYLGYSKVRILKGGLEKWINK